MFYLFEKKADEDVGCSHSRSISYFLESINRKSKFTAYKCTSQSSFLNGECKMCDGKEKCAVYG